MDWQEKNSNSPSPIGQVEEKQMHPSEPRLSRENSLLPNLACQGEIRLSAKKSVILRVG